MRPMWVLRMDWSAAMRPLRHSSRKISGLTESEPWPVSELLITTPACTTSRASSNWTREVTTFRYMRLSVTSQDSTRAPGSSRSIG